MDVLNPDKELHLESAEDDIFVTSGLQSAAEYPPTELESNASENELNSDLQNPLTELESDADHDALLPCNLGHSGVRYSIDAVTELESNAEDLDVDVPRKSWGKRRRQVRFHLDSSSCEGSDLSEHTGNRKKVKTNHQSFMPLLGRRCCDRDCLANVTRADAESAQKAFQEKSLGDQRTWLMEYFRSHSSCSEDGTINFSYNIGLVQVCATSWYQVTGIVRSRFYYWQKQFKDGVLYPLPPNYIKKGQKMRKTLNAKMQLNTVASSCGDRMPDQDSIHLPPSFTRKEVYRTVTDIHDDVCSESHFKSIWRKEQHQIRIPKINRFSKCDLCTELKIKLGRTNDKGVRKNLMTQHQEHVQKQSNERQKYYKHIQKAKSHPEKYMSIIIDGMDQHCTAIPQLHPTPKALSHTDQLHTHITGAIVHGRGQHTYIDFKEYPHDSNLTIHVLLNVLIRYADSLPPTLYLQLDNTARENKNRHVFAFLSLLVELKIFKKIKVGFLMVGHTHEDIDQLFSRISTHLKKKNITTLPKLLQAIPASFQRADCITTSERISHIFDVRQWLLPHQHTMQYHSKPHIFKFTMDQEEKATLQTKDWSTNPHWRETTGSSHILKSHPEAQPILVEKSFVDIAISHLPVKLQPYLEPEDTEAWKSLCELLILEEDDSGEDDVTFRWPICDLLLAEKSHTGYIREEVSSNTRQDEPFRQVHIGPKGKMDRRVDVQEGDMVATYLQEYSTHWPQVGRVCKVQCETIDVEWYTGTMTSKWKEVKLAIPGQRGRKKLWIDTIPSNSVILPPFKLTPGEKLPQMIANALREKHEDYFE